MSADQGGLSWTERGLDLLPFSGSAAPSNPPDRME